jgi:indole-3-glycerol phosphate synthase
VSFLDAMASGSRARVQAARRLHPEAALEVAARRTAAAPRLRLDTSGFDLIAELKLRSPAAGQLGAAADDLAARVAAYARGGATAVSVLTEPSRFDGALDHLVRVARALAPLGVPAMRKDFLVEPYQVLEARAAGAGGVLVILRMLSREELDALLDCAASLGLFVLLELIDADGGASQLLAGVNCRDLGTLEVVPARLTQLAPLLPAQVPRVAESGVATAADAQRVSAAGYQLALVGSALMQGGEPQALTAKLLAAGRATRQAP